MAALLEDNPDVLCENLQTESQNNDVLVSKALVGKIRSNKVLNVKAATDIIANAWSNYQGLKITELGKNLFLFSFAREEDKVEVLKRAPWVIMNQLFCLETWLPQVAYHQIEFNSSPF